MVVPAPCMRAGDVPESVSRLDYFDDDFVGAGIAFYLDRHANPFLFCLFFYCDSQLCAAGTRIGN